MTAQTDNTGLIERAREAAARYFENDHIDKARKAVAVLIRKGGTMDDQDATQIALYALAEADRQHAAALATKDAEIAAMADTVKQCRDQFAFYADEHRKAGKDEKATTNQRFADLCASVTPAAN